MRYAGNQLYGQGANIVHNVMYTNNGLIYDVLKHSMCYFLNECRALLIGHNAFHKSLNVSQGTFTKPKFQNNRTNS
jgi:hypothetical protein